MGLPDSTGRASYMGAMGSTDLRRGVEALKTFKKSIDQVLSDFEGSAGGTSKVGSQRVSRTSLSSGSTPFAEADGLFAQYHRVHQRLTELSKSLGEQIEAMGIAVHGADVGFDNVDEDMRRRFWAIRADTREGQDRYDSGNDAKFKGDELEAEW
ncbi:hypothetical protein ACWD6I_24580 [Streptomyces sp. NPDC002454]|uniref:hypothetical protein n=1 Tax=unclassified Streptomyces TaxID=2593676 RepID=UPI0033349F68